MSGIDVNVNQEQQQAPSIESMAYALLAEQESEHYVVSDVDKFATFSFLSYELMANRMARVAAEHILSRETIRGRFSEDRMYFWIKASYITSTLEHLLDEMEGSMASADKVRYLLERFDRSFYCDDVGEIPEGADGTRSPFVPQHGTMSQWFGVIECIRRSCYGKRYHALIRDMYGDECQ